MSELGKKTMVRFTLHMLNGICNLLELGAVVPLALALALESGARGAHSEHAPVLLEETEVGSIVLFVVPYSAIILATRFHRTKATTSHRHEFRRQSSTYHR